MNFGVKWPPNPPPDTLSGSAAVGEPPESAGLPSDGATDEAPAGFPGHSSAEADPPDAPPSASPGDVAVEAAPESASPPGEVPVIADPASAPSAEARAALPGAVASLRAEGVRVVMGPGAGSARLQWNGSTWTLTPLALEEE